MKHPPVTKGLDTANGVSADTWEEFFLLRLKGLAIARKRRAEQERSGDWPLPGGQQTLLYTLLPVTMGQSVRERVRSLFFLAHKAGHAAHRISREIAYVLFR